MLQRFIRWLVRLIADTFFRRIEVIGLENVPADGPVIFAGNHPNALMDGWLLTARCGRWPLHFLASAGLWKYRALAPLLDASGAIPVTRREDTDGEVDNRHAFDRVYEALESGQCVGIFPEGVSHVESQLVKLKTGTARIALQLAARGKAHASIVPCGLNYIHRHRFRSQVLIEFGPPIEIDDDWLQRYREDEQQAVIDLTETLAQAIRDVTLNAPDWRTLNFIQTVRRLYKPTIAELSPAQYVELSRRFLQTYLVDREDPEVQALAAAIEDYQGRLDLYGLKDYQLRREVSPGYAMRKILLRTLMMLVLLPLALPGALLHLPIGWIAAVVGSRFSYEMDDVATLKVLSSALLLPVLYLGVSIIVGISFGAWWGIATAFFLPLSFFASLRILETEAGLLNSLLAFVRVVRLGAAVDELRVMRADLVLRVRDRVERRVDPALERIFTPEDFSATS